MKYYVNFDPSVLGNKFPIHLIQIWFQENAAAPVNFGIILRQKVIQ